MRKQRPLGWWDAGSRSLAPTRRCSNEYNRIVELLATLKDHPDYQAVSGFTHQVLNLAASKSGMGDDAGAKQLHSKLRRALHKLAAGQRVEELKSLPAFLRSK